MPKFIFSIMLRAVNVDRLTIFNRLLRYPVGKIAKALDKYTDERKAEILMAPVGPPLSPADIEVLVDYDEKTGHLLKCDPVSGQVDESRIGELQSNAPFCGCCKTNLFIRAGRLTAKGIEEATRLAALAAALPRPIPTVEAKELVC